MRLTVKKAIVTLQSELPLLKEVKDAFYYHTRRAFAIPHEKDFKVLRCFSECAEACFLDVGANQGQTIESILLARPDARIVSFEANAVLAGKLAQRYKERQNVRVIARGLSDSPGSFTLFVPAYKGVVYEELSSLDRE